MAAASLSLISGFETFKDAIWTLLQKLHLGLSVTPAFADTNAAGSLNVPIVPILVYVTYILFAFG